MLRAAAHAGGPRCVIVRFVNVLGSQGSAPETFARQIRDGRPLTITDPRMRRYWITPQHANLLLLHAACLDDHATPAITVAPDAGEEIPLLEIAQRLWAALSPTPGEPQISVTGPRPGERLAEPLTAPGEWLASLPLAGLLAVRGQPPPPPGAVAAAVGRLADLLAGDASPEGIRQVLFPPEAPY
jgi:FlaA1/EpsC-like NDP-sugar epimerase